MKLWLKMYWRRCNCDRQEFVLRLFLLAILGLLFVSFPCMSGIQPFNLIPIAISVVFALLAFAFLYWKRRLALTPRMASLLLFSIYSVLMTLIGSRDYSMVFTIISNVLICCAVAEYVSLTGDGPIALFLYAVSMLVFGAVFCAFYWQEILSFNTERIGELFGNLNTVGLHFVLGAASFLGLSLMGKRRLLVFAIPGMVLGALSFLTGSRASLLMFALLVIVWIFVLFRKKVWLSIITVVCLALVGFAILSLPMFANIRSRLDELITTFFGGEGGNYDYSGVQRLNMIWDGLFLWTKNAIFGYGMGSFAALSGYGTYSHSTLVEILCNSGIIGLVLFAYPVLTSSFFYKNNSFRPFGYLFLIGCVIPCLFIGMMIYSKGFYFLFGVLLGAYENSISGFAGSLVVERKKKGFLPFIKKIPTKNRLFARVSKFDRGIVRL